MEQTSQRELRTVNPEWTVSELMARIVKALVSDGPALAFGEVPVASVPEKVAFVISTTGSSGISKSVGLSASALLSSAKASNKFLGAEYGNTWSLLLPLNHIAGLNVLIRCLELGTEPIDLRGYEGEYPKADFSAVVPTQLFRALNGDDNLLRHLQSTKAVLVGGAALSDALRLAAQDRAINIVTTYGMSETSGGCVYNGTPLDGVEFKIADDGRVAIKGSVLAHTYIGAQPQWDSQFIEGWFHSSDLGRIDDGRLVIEGRSDDVVISGGENISLTAIEDVLSKKYPHQNFAAFAIDDAQWGQALHLAIAGDNSPSQEEISEYLVKELGPTTKPKGFLLLSALPLIGIGKVDRRKLIELHVEASH